MLLDARWWNRPTGTTDNGTFVEFFATGTQYEGRIDTISRLHRARKPHAMTLELIAHHDVESGEWNKSIETYVFCKDYWGRKRKSLGFIPKSIVESVFKGMQNDLLLQLEVVETTDEAFGKKGNYGCKLRLHYTADARTEGTGVEAGDGERSVSEDGEAPSSDRDDGREATSVASETGVAGTVGETEPKAPLVTPGWHIPADAWVPGRAIEISLEGVEVPENLYEVKKEELCDPLQFSATMHQLATLSSLTK